MQRAGLGAQVRRKANPTTIKLADGKTQQLLDRYIEAVPVYFAPHACEPATFDILDTDFDIILGMPWLASADHTVNFHRRTLSVRDAFGAEVACTVPLPHSSIRCQVVTAKSFRATCAYEQPDEIGLCFLRTVAVAVALPTDLSSDLRVVRLLDEFADIFESPTGVVPVRPISHEIILEAGAVPPKGCIYRMSEEELEVLLAQLDDLLAKSWIRPSSSPYGAPVLFVRKKNKDLRLCIDYRKLSMQTVKNAGPLPRIDDLLERLGDAKYFSKLDLKSGYHQISIRPNDRYKSAFKTRYRHFEWVVMPFGLTNTPATFQAAMTNEFCAMLDRFDHLGHLRRVLETLRHAKYKANRDKCEFVWQELEYLGHFVTPEGISPLSDKIQAIQEWSEPRSVTDVRSFLGLAGYYQRFIKGYSKITAHLTKLQCEDRPFDFGEEARESFLALKAALLSAEVLRIYDPLLPTRVTTDASGCGIRAVLEQHDGVAWHPVEYFSKKVPVVHSIDDARKEELLAFVHALKRWRHSLLGRSQFRWVMDNNPLVFYKTQDTVNSTIARWMAFIDQFDFFPDHIPGKSNRFVDALSRRSDHCTAVYSTFEIDDDLENSFIRGYQGDPEFRDKTPRHCHGAVPGSQFVPALRYLQDPKRFSRRTTPATSITALTVQDSTGDLPACPVREASESLADYRGRLQAFTDAVAVAESQQAAAEAERQRRANEAAAEAQRTAETDEAARNRRNAASTESLIASEHQWTTILQGMIFVPTETQAEPTQAEAERSNLATAHLHAERQQRQQYQQDLAAVTAGVRDAAMQQQQQQQLMNSTIARINGIEANASAAPGCTTDATKQINERIDHVVTIIGDIGVFNGPNTISSTVAAIKTDITKLQTRPDAATKTFKMPHFDICKFDDYNKSDALTWWQRFLTEASCRTVPTNDMLKALYLQLIGGAQAWMNHLAATHKCTIAELHTHITWKEFEQLWFTRFMVRNVVKAAMNEVYTCSQGNMPTRDWTTKWQKIVTTLGFDLTFRNQ
ncbi:hypothetical protein CBR_g24029 [Chara braunii]|uniref:Reverse transcriptase domain-containing protein n=1 Tax=Chara braunii TaxID=69332 RepID=A0A388L5R4_CHABU|nr:hypothetical protein CBR_g24029 [Chara braunii]|eukprot:GBG77582.1 hypothetical protein CBR_g24029 [Chara braunii]